MRTLLICLLLPLLSACSVVMAAMGDKPPNVALLGQGQNRSLAENELGEPVRNATILGNATLSFYQYETGNAPSGGRAVGNLLIGVVSLGASELVMTPMEATRGSSFELPVLYDRNNTIMQVFPSRPLDAGPPKRAETREREERQRTHDKKPIVVTGVLQGFRKRIEARSLAFFDAHKKILALAGVDPQIQNDSLDERERVAEMAEEHLAPGGQTLDMGRLFGDDSYVVTIVGDLLIPRQDMPPRKPGPARFR
ncbi:MAG: hypothetical protein ACOCVM_09080 [Desulfovibrionaceae bacterium]